MAEVPKAGRGVDRSERYRMWRCAECRREFRTSYGLRAHRVAEHGAPRRAVRRSKGAP